MSINFQQAITNAANATAGVINTGLSSARIGLDQIQKLAGNQSDLSAFGNPSFPDDLDTKHYIAFGFSHYRRRSIYDRAQLDNAGNIRLPIPANLIDNQGVQYSQEGLGVVGGLAIDSLARGGNVTGQGLLGATATAAAAAATGSNAGQIGSLAGVAVNPFLSVLFKSPTFKKHSFAWKLSPNSPNESNTLVNLVEKFRYHMLPDLSDSTSGALLSYPDVVQINLYPNERYLYRFKPCVVESISVNYSPNITPAFYERTNAPIEVTLTVNLLEIEYWIRRDINRGALPTNRT